MKHVGLKDNIFWEVIYLIAIHCIPVAMANEHIES